MSNQKKQSTEAAVREIRRRSRRKFSSKIGARQEYLWLRAAKKSRSRAEEGCSCMPVRRHSDPSPQEFWNQRTRSP